MGDRPSKMPGNETTFSEEDGDECLSQLNLTLWDICIDVRQRYAADIIFTRADPSVAAKTDGCIDFFVPRDHPQAAEITQDLLSRIEPVRQLLEECHADGIGWKPGLSAHVRIYSGRAGASAKLEAVKGDFRQAVAHINVDEP